MIKFLLVSAIAFPLGHIMFLLPFITWLGMLWVYQTHLVEQVAMLEPVTFGCTPFDYLCLDIQHKNMTNVKIGGV